MTKKKALKQGKKLSQMKTLKGPSVDPISITKTADASSPTLMS